MYRLLNKMEHFPGNGTETGGHCVTGFTQAEPACSHPADEVGWPLVMGEKGKETREISEWRRYTSLTLDFGVAWFGQLGCWWL